MRGARGSEQHLRRYLRPPKRRLAGADSDLNPHEADAGTTGPRLSSDHKAELTRQVLAPVGLAKDLKVFGDAVLGG